MHILATLPAEITAAGADVTAGWDLARPIMIAIGLGFLVWGLLRKATKKTG